MPRLVVRGFFSCYNIPMKDIFFAAALVGALSLLSCTTTSAGGSDSNRESVSPPFSVASGLFNQASSNTLGLSEPAGLETVTIWKPFESGDHFCNGVVMTYFNGLYYAQWQSSAEGEDEPDTHVVYSTSRNAINWSEPVELCPATSDTYRSSGGWHVNNNTLVAFINEWPYKKSLRTGSALYMTSTDGTTWSDPAPVMMKDGSRMNGVIEQDIHSISTGRLVCAAHFSPGLYVCPVYTDDPSGVAGWVKADFKCENIGDTSREMEPSLFVNSSGQIVMIFRDQNSTFYKLAAVSADNGAVWSRAVLTNFPDARTKQSAGNFADGTSFMVGNPVTNKLRSPLAVALSKDGIQFKKAFLLKSGAKLTEPVYAGNAKRSGYHYPKSFVHDGYLYVTYSVNKEEAELVRVPISQLIGAE